MTQIARVASRVTATTDFLAPDILNKCGRAVPALFCQPQRTRETDGGQASRFDIALDAAASYEKAERAAQIDAAAATGMAQVGEPQDNIARSYNVDVDTIKQLAR